jgi:hypothetical protein
LCNRRGRNHRPAPIALDDGRSTEHVAAKFRERTYASTILKTSFAFGAFEWLERAKTPFALDEFLTHWPPEHIGLAAVGRVARFYTCTHSGLAMVSCFKANERKQERVVTVD